MPPVSPTLVFMEDDDWITNETCPYCKSGVMCRWEWWLECSRCDERGV